MSVVMDDRLYKAMKGETGITGRCDGILGEDCSTEGKLHLIVLRPVGGPDHTQWRLCSACVQKLMEEGTNTRN
jgi:hypothetical protein